MAGAQGGGGCITPQALQRAVDALHQRLAPHRRLRQHSERLFQDLLAVAAGLRAATMVDYALIEPGMLAAAVGDVLSALDPPCTHGCDQEELWVVAALDDCCYIVRPGLLQAEAAEGRGGQGAGAGMAQQLMAFREGASSGNGRVAPVWAGEEEAALVRSQFAGLVAALLEAAKQHRNDVTSIGAGLGSAPVGAPVAVVELDRMEGLPVLPTLSGLLLGYPAVYLVHDLGQAEAASRCLSTTSLVFYTAALALGIGASGSGRQGQQPQQEEVPLLAFSVPEELVGDACWEAHRAAWLARLRARVAAAAAMGYPWAGAALNAQTSMPRPVAL